MADLTDSLVTTKESAQHAASYSRAVRWLKFLLPLGAIAIVAVLLTWSDFDTSIIKPVSVEDAAQQNLKSNELIKPRYESVDSNGKPFTIIADKATQNSANPDEIYLQNPDGKSTGNSGWMAIKSLQGLYNQKSQLFNLRDDVVIYEDGGYELQTTKMDIDLQSGVATTREPVTGRGPAADLQASGMTATSDNNIVIFDGPATLTLYQDDKPDNSH